MLKDRVEQTSAAYEVGDESVSQFNREYSRFLDQPPTRAAKSDQRLSSCTDRTPPSPSRTSTPFALLTSSFPRN
jgi:hypothetical protein